MLVYDNVSSGQTTDNGTSLSVESMADATWSLITQLGLHNPIIVGESMGGTIAQEIARKHGAELNRLIIINFTMKVNQATLMSVAAQLKLREANIPFDLLFPDRLPWIFSAEFLSNPENVENFYKRLVNNPYPISTANQARQIAAVKMFDSRSWAGSITTPTLVISAKNDIVILSSEAQALAQTIPHATFVSIPGGHGSPFESPNELIAAIRSFC